MKIWALTRKNNKIKEDIIIEDEATTDIIYMFDLISKACEKFDIGKPLYLSKNENEIRDFNRTVFHPQDFIETVYFDTFEIEIIPEEDK